MSFNTNDNTPVISRSNYEEYFLLYVDNELSAEEKAAVENFLLAHPDLQAEMDILLSTKLPVENFSLIDKESLMSDSMALNTIDESLLLYIDNELKQGEKEKVEEKLNKDKEFQLQHQALMQTKLDPSEVVTYPNKKELYRHTERRIAPYWLRIAAAVIIVLGLGTFVLVNHQNTDTPSVAQNPEATKPANAKKQEAPEINEPVASPALAERKENKVEQKEKEVSPLKEKEERVVTQALAKKETPTQKNQPSTVEDPIDNNLPKPKAEEPANAIAVTEPARGPKQTINNEAVTSPAIASYNNQETAPRTAEQRDFLAEVDNDKKASLKGFLRKATRFIERRTNIKATNENDELLIGAVALKL